MKNLKGEECKLRLSKRDGRRGQGLSTCSGGGDRGTQKQEKGAAEETEKEGKDAEARIRGSSGGAEAGKGC
eukprot:scaffold51259_cov13-Tisochrysis_lutea.AAC.1